MVDRLIQELSHSGRDITGAEFRELRRLVAEAGFDPSAVARAGVDVAGLTWRGRIAASRDWLPSEDQHYLKHVVANREWPLGATLDEYVESLRDAVRNDTGAVSLELVHATRRLTFLSPSGRWRGPGGGTWILVGYNIGYGYWSTGYQPDQRQLLAIQEERPDRQWLQPLS